jgi:hypothetical protein
LALAKDYFPIVKDTEYIYEGFEFENGDSIRNTEYTSSNKQQFRIVTPQTELVSVYEYDSNGVKIIYLQEEMYHRQNLLVKTPNRNEYYIKNPIEIGTEWTLPGGSKSTITNIDMQVGTPYQLFTSALEVTTEGEGFKIVEYYEKNVGLVKSIIYSFIEAPFISILKEIKTNTPITETISFFYPYTNDNLIWYVDLATEFYTNDSVKKIFQNAFQNPPDCLSPSIGPNTYINYMYLDDTDNTAHIDFSGNFVSDLNSISGNENLSLLSITNTLGQYYMTEKVFITIEDNPYRSDSIQMPPVEAFQPNYNNILEWKNYPCDPKPYYMVQPGDTLSKIARLVGKSYQELARINNLFPPYTIYPGNVLIIY